MKKVQILLSTFNGEAYLKAQLDSILNQTHTNWELLIRDDASSDGTREIIENYVQKDSRIRFFSGDNLGVIQSFFELLKASDPKADFFAFCDQDDIWLEAKLERALNHCSSDMSFYFSRLQYVSSALRPIGLSRNPARISFSSALVENVATGCSVVFGRGLRDIALSALPKVGCLMHDWWLYILANAVGVVHYDSQCSVLYRQHGSNVVGAQSSFWAIYWTKLKRFWARGATAPRVSDQATAFLICYRSYLAPDKVSLIEDFLNSRKNLSRRLFWALRLPLKRQAFLDNCIFRVLILLGRY